VLPQVMAPVSILATRTKTILRCLIKRNKEI
jgi:hypothetical protein